MSRRDLITFGLGPSTGSGASLEGGGGIQGAASLQEIRREIGENLGVMASGTSEGDQVVDDTKDSFFDESVLDLFPAGTWSKGWVYWPTLPMLCRIDDFLSASGHMWVQYHPKPATLPNGLAYEVWKTFDPLQVNKRINDFLAKRATYLVQDTSVVLVAEQLDDYAVPAAAKDVQAVEYQDSDGLWGAVMQYEIAGVPGDYTLSLLGVSRGLPNAYPGNRLRITYTRYYDALDDEGDTTACPMPWLVASVQADLYRGLMTKTMKADREQVKENIALWEAEAQRFAGLQRSPTSGPRQIPTRKVSD